MSTCYQSWCDLSIVRAIRAESGSATPHVGADGHLPEHSRRTRCHAPTGHRVVNPEMRIPDAGGQIAICPYSITPPGDESRHQPGR